MKKKFVIRFFTFFSFIMLSVNANAFQMGLGAYSYYNWQDFAWSDAENFQSEPLLQAGPVLNLTWAHKVSLSLSVIIPTMMSHADYDYKPLVTNQSNGKRYKLHIDNANIIKTDIDLALSYAVLPQLKIFIGAKSMDLGLIEGSETVFTGVDQADSSILSNQSKHGEDSLVGGGSNAFYRNSVIGGAIGVNYSIPFFESFSFVSNLSFLYLKSKIETALPEVFNNGFETSGDETISGSYNSVGSNIAFSLAYYCDSINTAFSLGGRYQVLYNMFDSGMYSGTDKKFDNVWGVTFSAMYFANFFEEE